MLYGFDIGGSKIAFAVFDKKLNCLFSDQAVTPDNYTAFTSLIINWVKEADTSFNVQGVVGIGFPGIFDEQSRYLFCANVVAINGSLLIDDLSESLHREIKIDNDANCFLLSECYFGVAYDKQEDKQSVLAVTLGTGVGGAFFVNGALHHGHNGLATEIGHIPLPATLFLKYPKLPVFNCGCGAKACLETYISGSGLTNLYAFYASQQASAPEILAKERAGEKVASEVVDLYFDILASGLAMVITLLDPDMIVFGGGLSKIENLTDQLTERLPQYLLQSVPLPALVYPKFGVNGGVRGAALLNYSPSS